MPRVTITLPAGKSQPYRFALERKSVSLGRGSENDIVVECSSISVRHAVMERVTGGYRLRDLGSTNGTKLDGKTKEVIELYDGAPVKIGDVIFGFSLSDDEVSTLNAEKPADESPIIQEEEQEAPEQRRIESPRLAPQRAALAASPSSGASFLMTLVFLLLASGAFYLGMSIRHSEETGRSLTQDIKHGVPEIVDPNEVLLPETSESEE